MKYLMGIDNGGTFSKVAIFNTTGKQIAVTSEKTEVLTPKPGFTERDMDDLWKANVKAIKGAIVQAGIDPGDIAGISFSGHGKGLYLTDEHGNPTYPGIISTDNRAWEYADRWLKDGTAEKIYPLTYQTILPCQPVCLLAWLVDNEPQVVANSRYIFSVKDFIRFKLTGIANGEITDFSGGNLVNLNTGSYDKEILRYFGLDELWDKLPPLKRSEDLCGEVSLEAAAVTGLCPGTPVAAGMFDVNACGISSGLNEPDKLCMIAGTWAINEYISKKPIVNGTVKLNSMFCIPGYYLIEESSPTSAGNLEWFLRTFFSAEREISQAKGESFYGKVDAWVEDVDPSDSTLIFLPFLNGSNEDPLARGTLIGLTMYHNKRHILRAVFEGVVFSHLTHLENLLKNREVPEAIRISGGAANSRVWLQIFADVLQIPIEVVASKEQGAQGAAMVAGIAAGIYKDYDEAIDNCVEITHTVMPRPDYAAVYQKKYQDYRSIISSLSGIWKSLNR